MEDVVVEKIRFLRHQLIFLSCGLVAEMNNAKELPKPTTTVLLVTTSCCLKALSVKLGAGFILPTEFLSKIVR